MRKTKKAVRMRFRFTKSGKLKRARPGKSHLLSGKSRGRKRHLRRQVVVSNVDQRRLKEFLPHG